MLNGKKRISVKNSLKKDVSRGLELFLVTDIDHNEYFEVKQHEFSFYTELLCEGSYLYDKLFNTFGN